MTLLLGLIFLTFFAPTISIPPALQSFSPTCITTEIETQRVRIKYLDNKLGALTSRHGAITWFDISLHSSLLLFLFHFPSIPFPPLASLLILFSLLLLLVSQSNSHSLRSTLASLLFVLPPPSSSTSTSFCHSFALSSLSLARTLVITIHVND